MVSRFTVIATKRLKSTQNDSKRLKLFLANLIPEKLGESNKHWKNTGITRIAHSYLRFIPYRLFTTAYNNVFFLCSIPYTAIQSATSQRRMFHLVYLSLDGEETSLNFKLDSSQSASGLYRAITEKHAFYSCETVRSAVTAQFIRDLKVLPFWLYRNANESINRLFLAGHYNLDIQRGLDVGKEIRVRHPQNVQRGVRQRAASSVLRSCDRYFAGGEGNFGEARLRGLRGAQMQGIEQRRRRKKGIIIFNVYIYIYFSM